VLPVLAAARLLQPAVRPPSAVEEADGRLAEELAARQGLRHGLEATTEKVLLPQRVGAAEGQLGDEGGRRAILRGTQEAHVGRRTVVCYSINRSVASECGR